jgi:diacylglycerol kinase family enzyme
VLGKYPTLQPSDYPPIENQPILLVGNPTSRSGKAVERFPVVRRMFEQLEVDFEFRETLPGGLTSDLVSDAVREEGFRTVVYIGGDGTFNEVAKGVFRSGLAAEARIGMIPSGTANDQGKSFGIPSAERAIGDNVRVIAEGHTTQLDIGEVSAFSDTGVSLWRDLFFDSVGWGLSAAILAFRNRERNIVSKLPVVRDMYRDQMVYIRAAVRELALSWVTRDRFTADVEVDGEGYTLDGLSDLTVNNTSIYAGEWLIDASARHDDGLFELTPFRGIRDWTSKLILYHKRNPLTEELVNRIGISHSPGYRGGCFQLHILRPTKDVLIPAQLDGEEFPAADHFEIRVHPRVLSLIVPVNYHWI